MGHKFKDITGQKFNRLTAISRDYESPNGNIKWFCKCDCGNDYLVKGSSLRDGSATSCGCYKRERTIQFQTTHGMTNTSICNIWNAMKRRCSDNKSKAYKYYGGRGIKVCERWKHSFENFYSDMGERPSKKHSLDRFPDMNGNYEKNNCRWATTIEQAQNKRSNTWIEYNGEKKILIEWSRYLNVNAGFILYHLGRGRSFDFIYNEAKKRRGLI